MNRRPEIVLPPGFALRIDYDPESSPASLLITAYRGDAPVGQTHLDPREVGHRLRLDVEGDENGAAAREPRLRLTPERSLQGVMLDSVRVPMPPRVPTPDDAAEVERAPLDTTLSAPASVPARDEHAAMAALHQLARDVAIHAERLPEGGERPHSPNALVWLESGAGVILPGAPASRPLASLAERVSRQLREDMLGDDGAWSPVQRAFRALSSVGELLGNPLRLREADETWISWRGSWRGAHQASGAGDA